MAEETTIFNQQEEPKTDIEIPDDPIPQALEPEKLEDKLTKLYGKPPPKYSYTTATTNWRNNETNTSETPILTSHQPLLSLVLESDNFGSQTPKIGNWTVPCKLYPIPEEPPSPRPGNNLFLNVENFGNVEKTYPPIMQHRNGVQQAPPPGSSTSQRPLTLPEPILRHQRKPSGRWPPMGKIEPFYTHSLPCKSRL